MCKLVRKRRAEKTVIGSQRDLNPAQPRERHVAQTAAYRITYHQGANQYGAADGRADQRAQVRPGVKVQTAEDEGQEGHKLQIPSAKLQ